MLKRYVTLTAAQTPVPELDPEARKALRKNFNPLAARRFTALSLLLGEVTREANPTPADEWIFASQYGASISLEQYLGSFPTPSPLHFQNSIQPGPIDLVNVARQAPARQLLPLIGKADVLGEALLAALVSPAATVHLTAGEEHEAWAAERDLGSPTTFALYLKLERQAEAPLAEIIFTPGEFDLAPPPALDAATEQITARTDFAFSMPECGAVRLSWR